MAKVDDVLAKTNAKITRLEKAVGGVAGDVQFLKEQLATIKAGDLSPEQETAANLMDERLEAVTTKLEGVDAATEPPPSQP